MAESRTRNRRLDDVIAAMTIVDGADYFALTLTAAADGTIMWGAQTGWVGESPTRPGWEMREPCLVKPHVMLDLWRGIGQPGLVVNTADQLGIFLRVGGHALVLQEVAEEWLPDLIAPAEYAQVGLLSRVKTTDLADEVKRRAPTPRVRMDVIKRDRRRCKICGRRPDDDVDLDINVHHIRPSGAPYGGLSDPSNLITLCDTCHKGLDPHADFTLFELIDGLRIDDVLRRSEGYDDSVRRYRERVVAIMENRTAR